jgi:cell division septal protein FtsQ
VSEAHNKKNTQKKPKHRSRTYIKYTVYFLVLIFLFLTFFFTIYSQNFTMVKFRSSAHKFIFGNVVALEVIGGRYISEERILAMSYTQNTDDMMSIKPISEIVDVISRIPIVKTVSARIKLPDTLIVVVQEHTPVFFMVQGGDIVIINSDYDTIKYPINVDGLIYHRGEYSKDSLKRFFTKIDEFQNIKQNITEVENFLGYRYNIVLRNKTQVLLPENNIRTSLAYLSKLILRRGLLDSHIKKLDLRNPNKIFITRYAQNEENIYIPQPKRLIAVRDESIMIEAEKYEYNTKISDIINSIKMEI